MDQYEEDQYIGGIIDTSRTKGSLKEYQTVIAVGDTVKSIKVGDVVSLNLKRYAVMQHKDGSMKDGVISDNPVIGYRLDTIDIDGKECLKLYDTDINFIIEEMEEVEDSGLILPETPKIIV